jgi:hypothetical protein
MNTFITWDTNSTPMQQLKIEHKNTKKDRREGKGRVLATSRMVYKLQNTNNTFYYVESETCDNIFYFAKFKPDVLEDCSCKDNSTRHLKCKHLFAIEFAIKWGTIKDIDKSPTILPSEPTTTTVSKSYLEDDYDF